MALDVIEGPLATPPEWIGGTVTFVRTNNGLRALGEPRTNGSFLEQMAAWGADVFMGGARQFWRVRTGVLNHPEVVIAAASQGAGQDFEIALEFNVQVVDAKEAVNHNLRTLEGCFTPYLKRDILPIARRYDIAQSADLQRELEHHFGDRFGNNVVKGTSLSIRVHPKDEAVRTAMSKVGAVPAMLAGVQADYVVQHAQIEAFRRQTGNMTIHDMAMAAIGTGNEKLRLAYETLTKRHDDAGQRNWETLKFLVEQKVIEPHQIEKHLGQLAPELMKSLITLATPTPQALPKP